MNSVGPEFRHRCGGRRREAPVRRRGSKRRRRAFGPRVASTVEWRGKEDGARTGYACGWVSRRGGWGSSGAAVVAWRRLPWAGKRGRRRFPTAGRARGGGERLEGHRRHAVMGGWPTGDSPERRDAVVARRLDTEASALLWGPW